MASCKSSPPSISFVLSQRALRNSPRSGRNVSQANLSSAINKVYNVESGFAGLLALGGLLCAEKTARWALISSEHIMSSSTMGA